MTPERVGPQVTEAVSHAVPSGQCVPIVCNTTAYDRIESLDLLDGAEAVQMPDFKYRSAQRSKRT